MLAYLFVLLAVLVRLVLPGFNFWFNFTPVGASLLFFGANQPRKRMWIPVLLLVGSDVLLNLFIYHYAIHAEVMVSWAWYAALLLFGSLLRDNATPVKVFGASLFAAFGFFFVSNTAAWAAMDMYPKTVQGLMTAYVAAIPFFRNELLSDVLFSALFFSIPVALHHLRHEPAKVRVRS